MHNNRYDAYWREKVQGAVGFESQRHPAKAGSVRVTDYT
jgi:hypothetical protein